MALEIPNSASEIDNSARTDVQNELTGSDPFSKNHWLAALVTAFSNRIFDFYEQLLNAIDANLPDTAFGAYLARWMAIFRISQLAATKASGNVVATGTASSSIPSATIFADSAGDTYISTAAATITETILAVDSIARSGQVATVTFLNAHSLASGVTVTIAGADQTDYNGDFVITVTDDNVYTYTVSGGPTTPATGTITSAATTASVPIQAETAGLAGNLANGEQVTLQSPIAGVDDTLTTDFGEVGGGSDEETTDAAQARLVERIQEPVAHFNPADIKALAKTINGVTRVFVQTPSSATTNVLVNLTRLDDGTDNNVVALATIQSGVFSFFSGQPITITDSDQANYNIADTECIITGADTLVYSVGSSAQDPAGSQATITGSDVPLGTAKVFFMRDNDADPIPTASEILEVRTLLLTINPANTSENDLVVDAPTAVPVDFTFLELTPSTATMQAAIETNLKQMFADRTDVGIDLSAEIYESAIINTYDETEGVFVESFTLTDPTGDVTIASSEIPTLGTLTFP